MATWLPVITVGAINLAGLAFAAGMVLQRLKNTEKNVDALPAQAKEAARVMDLEHLLECHPRAAKRAQSQLEISP
jgi:hypothetical protein